MEQMIQQRLLTLPVIPGVNNKRTPAVKKKLPETAVKFPPRGTTGPIPIGAFTEYIQWIGKQPDRNELLAELFSEE